MRNQPLTQEQREYIFGNLVQKIHTNLLGNKLEEDPIHHPEYYPAKISDGQYLSLLKLASNNPEIKERAIIVIKNLCNAGVNIDSAFEAEQARKLKIISPKIEPKEIQAFFETELARLSGARVKPEEIEIESISEKALAQQKREVDLLIRLDESNRRFSLDKDKFSMLIREYSNDINEIMKNKSNDDLKSRNLERTKKIATLIDNNKDSLEWLQETPINTKSELLTDVIRFMHAMAYKGDIKSFKILKDKIGEENLLHTLNSIPLGKEELEQSFDGQITLKGIISIIDRRAGYHERRDSADWKDLGSRFKDFLEIKKQHISEYEAGGSAVVQSPQVRGPASAVARASDGSKSGPKR